MSKLLEYKKGDKVLILSSSGLSIAGEIGTIEGYERPLYRISVPSSPYIFNIYPEYLQWKITEDRKFLELFE